MKASVTQLTTIRCIISARLHPLSESVMRWAGRFARLIRWLVALLLGLVAVLQSFAYFGWEPLPAK